MCLVCLDTTSTAVSSHIEYVSEVCSFEEQGIKHEHDFNPRVTVWRCQNGHEFTLKGVKRCTGCMLERELNSKRSREQAASVSRPRAPAVPYNIFI